jgi:small-conductance mechanosensitive channel
MWNSIEHAISHLPDVFWDLFLLGCAIVAGLFVKFIFSLYLKKSAQKEDFSLFRSIIRRLGKPLNFFLPLIILNLLLPLMRIKASYVPFISKIVEILISISVAYLLVGVLKVCEDYVYHAYNLHKPDNLRERKIRTQLQFLRRVLIWLIFIVTVCIILLSFENLRRLGAGLLTGVGVGGIIIGFAAQRSLANLLAGFQIAFTQPIRIEDVLVVEGEFGRVEEITLTYVVLSIWDQRRLILPINYFIEKPFQNWTRTNAELIGTVLLYLDYNVPVDALRQELKRLLKDQPLWDERVAAIQVTNATERTVEVRVLLSASNSGNAFDLRCYIRENLLAFVQKNYPQSLPQTRFIEAERADQNV